MGLVQWFQGHLDIVFFFYGLSFIVMGIAIFVQPKKGSQFKLADILWLLAVFGIIHGINEFLDMWEFIKGEEFFPHEIHWFTLTLSYFFLLEFGRRILCLIKTKTPEPKNRPINLFCWWLSPALVLLVCILSFISSDFHLTGTIWTRYLLGFPGSFLTGLGFYLYYVSEEKKPGLLKVKKCFVAASLSFIIYAILGGLFVNKSNIFLSPWLNADSFLWIIKIPVQVFRAICTLISTGALVGMLQIFNWETTTHLLEAQKRLEGQLEESEQRYREIFENAFDMIYSLDKNGFIVSLNRQAGELSGYEKEELIGKHFHKICPPETWEKIEKRIEQLPREGSISIDDGELITKTNEILNIENHVLAIYDVQGNLAGMRFTIKNVTARKKTERELQNAYTQLKETQGQLIQSTKLNAIGYIASGVAHEVRNPLGIIIMGVNYLEKKLSSDPKNILEVLEMIKSGVQRADKIISALLDFSRASKLTLLPEDINQVLDVSLSLISKSKLSNIEIVKEMKKDMPQVLIDRNKMEQVFVNIFLNAIQAMPNGGKLIIRSNDVQIEKPQESVNEVFFKPGEKAVSVEIEDTGIGIPEEHLKKIFEPFFTTKSTSGGTGLGLSVTQNIINSHKGLIDIKSHPGKGTRVIITLEIKGEENG
ncbi:MAG: ATP-binding protein [Candidatus Omnitrophota bacterium]